MHNKIELETLKMNLTWRSFIILAAGFTVVTGQQEDPAVTNFREFLRIPTVHPNPQPGYEQAIEWLRNQANQLDVDFNLLDLGEDADFALWLTWNGTNPSLKSVLFHSHMDVVAADPEKWEHHPFEAYKDAQGNIFARGASDMKCATIATLEAVRRLKSSRFKPLRTIHIAISPDEEKGGRRGIRPFLETPEFQNLNVGIDIDEGGVSPDSNKLGVRFTEKIPWEFNISAKGLAGHGSTLPQYTAGHRLHVVISRLLEFREEQYRKLQNPDISLDDLTVLNLVQLGGGLAENIIPNELWATFDMRIRITPQWNFTDVENLLLNTIDEARLGSDDDPTNDVSISYIAKYTETGETVANSSNIWWNVVQDTCQQLNITCDPVVSNGATDGRFIRHKGVPVFGLGPFLNTPSTAHNDNEFINEVEFLNGVDRYVALIRNLATTPASENDRA